MVFSNTVFCVESIIHLLFFSKAAVRRFSTKEGVLNNFAKVTETTCAGVSVLIKLQISRFELYSERDSGTNVFL